MAQTMEQLNNTIVMNFKEELKEVSFNSLMVCMETDMHWDEMDTEDRKGMIEAIQKDINRMSSEIWIAEHELEGKQLSQHAKEMSIMQNIVNFKKAQIEG